MTETNHMHATLLDHAARGWISIMGLAGAIILNLGCTPPQEADRLDQAMSESRAVLELHEKETAGRWHRWLASHSFRDLLDPAPPGIEFIEIPGHFEATAYAAPILEAVPNPDDLHPHPILGPPADSIPASALPTRREYAAEPSLRPPVIGWVADGLDAYLAEVNGSVGLRFPDGSIACLDWVRTNERPYTSLGRRLVDEGHATAEGLTLQTIREIHREDPGLVESLMLDNDRVVYFRRMACDHWPEASTGVRLVARHSIAVDPETIPLGSLVMVRRPDGETMIAMAVDTGGAIKGRRMDLFLGTGAEAVSEAGGVVESVRAWILRPDE